jgi:hypothetical protein
LLKIWLLDTDDHSKKLIFETGLCDNEVDNSTLSGSLWLVVRIDEFGLQIELESVSNLDVLGSESHSEVLTFLDELS